MTAPAERCERTDLLVSDCAHCRGHQSVEEQVQAERVTDREHPGAPGPWFAARWDGECSGCGDPINVGDTIRADGEGGYELWGCRP